MGILINSFDSFPIAEEGGSIPTALDLSGLVGCYLPSSINGTTGCTWDDVSGNDNHLATSSSKPDKYTGGTNDQVRFDGVDQYLEVSSNTIYDFVPQTDAFSIVYKLGDTGPTNDTAFLGISHGATGLNQYSVRGDSSVRYIIIGGTQTSDWTGGFGNNELGIITVSTSELNYYLDGVTSMSAGSIGTYDNATLTFRIGGNSSAADFEEIDFEFIAIYNRVLTAQEITDIETDHQTN